ncbi:hypothetical protein LT493_24610 [Streptomyces tricolor]|nr:hypothetical protein [Streptomyces tricolor]
MRKNRWCVAVTAALPLAGCGGGAESDGCDGRAVALTKEQVRETLPDGAAMPGWKESARPTAVEMDRLYGSQACPRQGQRGLRQLPLLRRLDVPARRHRRHRHLSDHRLRQRTGRPRGVRRALGRLLRQEGGTAGQDVRDRPDR